MSEDWKATMEAALRADVERNYGLAEELSARVIVLNPRYRPASLLRALSVAKQGRTEEALAKLDEFLVAEPKSSVALNWKSKLLRESGQLSAALLSSERAFAISPRDAETLYNLGLSLFGLGRSDEAIDALTQAIKHQPGFHAAYYALACVYEAMGQPWQALIACRKNVEQFPYPDGYLKLGQLYLSVNNQEAAESCALKALDRPALAPQANLLLAEALADSDPARSASFLQRALAADPYLISAYRSSRSRRLSRLGRIDEAIAIHEETLKGDCASGSAFLNLVTLKRITEGDRPLVAQMESVLGKSGLGLSDQIYLHFALGKAFDNLSDYEQAMHHYDAANELQVRKNPRLANFDRDHYRRRVDLLIQLFTPQRLAQSVEREFPEPAPIFIVGMMRSGTTLVEQILSRHSEVEAGGELAYWTAAESKLLDLEMLSVRADRLQEYAEGYALILWTIAKGAPFVTDKNPANCFALGQISLAYPHAHIVHVERDPVETALSIYITPLRNPPEFGCIRENIRFAIDETRRLLDHWQAVIPTSHLHRVVYEDLVQDQEATTRKLIADCGLNWEEDCLHPEGSHAPVGTPSLWQARQPVNSGSLQRSTNYGPWLRDFEARPS